MLITRPSPSCDANSVASSNSVVQSFVADLNIWYFEIILFCLKSLPGFVLGVVRINAASIGKSFQNFFLHVEKTKVILNYQPPLAPPPEDLPPPNPLLLVLPPELPPKLLPLLLLLDGFCRRGVLYV